MQISRRALLSEANRLQHALSHSEKVPELPGASRYDALAQNQQFLDRLDGYPGETLPKMIASADRKNRAALRTEDIVFGTGMAVTLAGFGGIIASMIWPSPLAIAGTVVALGLGPGLTHEALQMHSPHADMARQLGDWQTYLETHPPARGEAPPPWPRADEISRQRLEERAACLADHPDSKTGREVYNVPAREHPPFAAWLRRADGSSLAALKKKAARQQAFHRFMADGVLDGLEILQGGVVLGALTGFLHPGVSLLGGLAVGGAISGLSLLVPRWQAYHFDKARQGEHSRKALDSWLQLLAREESRARSSAEELREMAAPPDRSYDIEKTEDRVRVGPIWLERRPAASAR
ncbi:MAG: hypothetical protein HY319_10680 [Armatimonadetes bacterium]|nr:hypothetical protein [Armatimonadota bacterium]